MIKNLSKDELIKMYVNYLQHPDETSYNTKTILWEAESDDKEIHYKALEITNAIERD